MSCKLRNGTRQGKARRGEKMTTETKAMINMAAAIAEINGTQIMRMDLQGHDDKVLNKVWYHLDVWYMDGKEVTIRQDCTIVKR